MARSDAWWARRTPWRRPSSSFNSPFILCSLKWSRSSIAFEFLKIACSLAMWIWRISTPCAETKYRFCCQRKTVFCLRSALEEKNQDATNSFECMIRERELHRSLHLVKTELSEARKKMEEMASRMEMVNTNKQKMIQEHSACMEEVNSRYRKK